MAQISCQKNRMWDNGEGGKRYLTVGSAICAGRKNCLDTPALMRLTRIKNKIQSFGRERSHKYIFGFQKKHISGDFFLRSLKKYAIPGMINGWFLDSYRTYIFFILKKNFFRTRGLSVVCT